MIVNPILRRELKTALRARVTLALAAVYLVALAGIIALMWPATGVFSLAEQASRSILLVFSITQLLLVILYAPAFAATAITSEKEQNSYELLFATLLRPRQIIAGKLLASIVSLLIFVVLSLPAFTMCFFLGAVSVQEAAVIYLIAVASSVFFGLLGLSVSALTRRSPAALIKTYLVILVVCAAPWIPYVLLRDWTEGAVLVHGLRAISPVAAVASVLVPTFGMPGLVPPAWQVYLVVAAGGSLVLFVILLAKVYRAPDSQTRRRQSSIVDPAELARRKLRFPFYLLDPMRRRRNIPNWMNPIFAREMRNKAFGGGIWIFRSAYLCFAISVGLIALVAGSVGRATPDLIRTVALAFQVGLIVLVVPSLTVGAVTAERERQNLDLLRLTRVQAARFLIGKFTVAGLFVLFLVIGFLPWWYAVQYLQSNTITQIAHCWAVLGSTMLLALTTGLVCSALARRTATATAMAYGFLFLLTVATLLPALAPDRLGGTVAELLYGANPLVATIQVLTSEVFQQLPEVWGLHLKISLGLSGIFLLIAGIRVHRMLEPEP